MKNFRILISLISLIFICYSLYLLKTNPEYSNPLTSSLNLALMFSYLNVILLYYKNKS